MLFLKGDSNFVTVKLESSVSTSGVLEVPLSGICAFPSESQIIMTIVRNVERPVVIWRFQCCSGDVSTTLLCLTNQRKLTFAETLSEARPSIVEGACSGAESGDGFGGAASM